MASSAAPSVAGSVPPSPAPSVAAQATAPVSNRMEHFTRGPTSSGGRNMQDTTFSLSAEYPSKILRLSFCNPTLIHRVLTSFKALRCWLLEKLTYRTVENIYPMNLLNFARNSTE